MVGGGHKGENFIKHHGVSGLSRRFLQLTASLAIAVFPLAAQGQTDYPARNIRVIVPSPTGGPSDIVARVLGDKLVASLGK